MAIDPNTLASHMQNIHNDLDRLGAYIMESGQEGGLMEITEDHPVVQRLANKMASVKLRSFLDVLDQMGSTVAEAEGFETEGPIGDGRTAREIFDEMDQVVEEHQAEPAPLDDIEDSPSPSPFPVGADGDYEFSADPAMARRIFQQVQGEENGKPVRGRDRDRMDRYELHAEEMGG